MALTFLSVLYIALTHLTVCIYLFPQGKWPVMLCNITKCTGNLMAPLFVLIRLV